jgi:squalene-hopene/tetraprenyl-beta-curcumene cyclase
LSLARGETSASHPELTARIHLGLEWLLGLQNKDGGFGTWERETLLSKVLRKTMSLKGKSNLVFSESVTEHSARIVVNLSQFQNDDLKYKRAYDRGVQWLLKQQNDDGSYSGAWFVDYLFGTAMVTNALGTASDRPEVASAIEKALNFILSHQQADGGFSESPESFTLGKSIALPGASSPAQTALVVTQLMSFLEHEHYAHLAMLRPPLERAVSFLKRTQQADGIWHDQTWTGVTFPKLEYSIYPYVQEMSPAQAIGMFARLPVRVP